MIIKLQKYFSSEEYFLSIIKETFDKYIPFIAGRDKDPIRFRYHKYNTIIFDIFRLKPEELKDLIIKNKDYILEKDPNKKIREIVFKEGSNLENSLRSDKANGVFVKGKLIVCWT